MKFVDKFVLVPVEKWELISKKENIKILPNNNNNQVKKENSQESYLKNLIPQPHLKKGKKRKWTDSYLIPSSPSPPPPPPPPHPHTHPHPHPHTPLKRKNLVLNTQIKNLKGKGENNLPTSRITATVISRVPEKYKNRVAAFLHYLKRSPDLKWTKVGTIYYKGQRIEDSNVADLTYHALRENDTSKPTGYQLFYQHVFDAGVPLFFIRNKIGLKIISQTLQEVDDDWRPPGQLIKKYKPKAKLNWEDIK